MAYWTRCCTNAHRYKLVWDELSIRGCTFDTHTDAKKRAGRLYFNLDRPLLDTNIIQFGIVSRHPSQLRPRWRHSTVGYYSLLTADPFARHLLFVSNFVEISVFSMRLENYSFCICIPSTSSSPSYSPVSNHIFISSPTQQVKNGSVMMDK